MSLLISLTGFWILGDEKAFPAILIARAATKCPFLDEMLFAKAKIVTFF